MLTHESTVPGNVLPFQFVEIFCYCPSILGTFLLSFFGDLKGMGYNRVANPEELEYRSEGTNGSQMSRAQIQTPRATLFGTYGISDSTNPHLSLFF